MNLTFVDGEVDALENLLLGFGNHGGEVLDLEDELLLGLTPGSLRRRVDGGGEAGAGTAEESAGRGGPECKFEGIGG